MNPDELVRSSRLGINYNGIKNKLLISYDIDDNIKKEIIEKKLKYELHELEEHGKFSKFEFSISVLNYTKYFYFRSWKYISPSTYYSRNWETDTSKYFIFKISEPKYFNDYCIKKLDEFVDKTADLLEYTNDEKHLLETKKIYYIFCKDENEIKTVSGFDTRGIYITAFDEVITTYNTHYHELAHLLMNYKLKNLNLYTLPFFMEGFAVAIGGRGGLAPRVVTDIGLYLQVKGILSYDSIITNEGFNNENASLTYPLAGLYNLFLMNTMGMNKYFDLYKSVNGDPDYINKINLSDLNLPKDSIFNKYLEEYFINSDIFPFACDTFNVPFGGGEKRKIDTLLYHKFDMSWGHDYDFLYNMEEDNVNRDGEHLYLSSKYKELFSKDDINRSIGIKYVLITDTNFVKIYNLFNNELIAEYEEQFSVSGLKVSTRSSIKDVIIWIKDSLIDGKSSWKWMRMLKF